MRRALPRWRGFAVAATVVGLAATGCGSGKPPIDDRAAQALQTRVQALRQAAASHDQQQFDLDITNIQQLVQQYRTRGEITADRARDILDALGAVQTVGLTSPSPTPSATTPAPTETSAGPSPTPTPTTPPPTTPPPTTPPPTTPPPTSAAPSSSGPLVSIGAEPPGSSPSATASPAQGAAPAHGSPSPRRGPLGASAQ